MMILVKTLPILKNNKIQTASALCNYLSFHLNCWRDPLSLMEWDGPVPLWCELNLLGRPCGVAG